MAGRGQLLPIVCTVYSSAVGCLGSIGLAGSISLADDVGSDV